MLEKLKIEFVQEAKFGRYHADFLVGQTVIECDGEFWHNPKTAKLKDRRRDMYLRKLGYKVIRLTGQQINRMGDPDLYKALLRAR